ncbi:MAG: hypothetical protein ABII90_09135 [Bacteroidota bacterium]
MKIILTVLIILLINLSANGQTEKKAWMIGGNANFALGFSETKDTVNGTNFWIDLSPKIGYFILNNFAFGMGIPLKYNMFHGKEIENQRKLYLFNVGLSPFIRYYFNLSNQKIFLHTDFSFSQTFKKSTNLPAHENADAYYDIYAGFGIGLAYFIKKNIGLEGILYYEYFNSENDYYYTIRKLNFGIGLQIYLTKNTTE